MKLLFPSCVSDIARSCWGGRDSGHEPVVNKYDPVME